MIRAPPEWRMLRYAKHVVKRRTLIAFALTSLILIASLSMLPQRYKSDLHTQGALHPWLHLFAFSLVAALLMAAVRTRASRGALFIGLLVFGLGTEVTEQFMTHSKVEMSDVLADSLGVVLGTVLVSFRSLRS